MPHIHPDDVEGYADQRDRAATPLNPVESGAAMVIARKPCRAGGGHIVLCFLGLENPTPYVTWLEFVSQGTGRTVYESGHYYYARCLTEAVKDFNER